jgi:hypothetical protein
LRRLGAEQGNYALAWEGAAETSENITYTVQASTDEGKSWIALRIGELFFQVGNLRPFFFACHRKPTFHTSRCISAHLSS